jgi:hypothetical protein
VFIPKESEEAESRGYTSGSPTSMLLCRLTDDDVPYTWRDDSTEGKIIYRPFQKDLKLALI